MRRRKQRMCPAGDRPCPRIDTKGHDGDTITTTADRSQARAGGEGSALKLGFWESAILFAVVIAIPAVGWARGRFNPIFAFWFAYVVTRPLGASFADGFSKPVGGGLGMGDGTISLIALVVFVGLVTWVSVTKRDVQRPARARHHRAHLPHPHLPEPGVREPQVAEN